MQVALPLGYYLGLRQREDERFAWRMFSAVRLDRCDASVTVRDPSGEARALPIEQRLQRGWFAQLARGQPNVVDRVLARACEDEHALAATLVRRCRGADGAEAPPERVTRSCRPGP